MGSQHPCESFECCLVLSSVLKTLPCCILRSPPQIIFPCSLTLTIPSLKCSLSFTLNRFLTLIFIFSPINEKLAKLHFEKLKEDRNLVFSTALKEQKNKVQGLVFVRLQRSTETGVCRTPFSLLHVSSPRGDYVQFIRVAQAGRNKTLSSCGSLWPQVLWRNSVCTQSE